MSLGRRPRTLVLSVLAVALAAGLSGCGADEEPQLGAVGVEAAVGDLALRDVELDNPPDGVYEVGSAARLNLAIVNQGRADDHLVAVSGPNFDGVAIDDAEAGTPLRITIPAGGTVYTGTSGEADLILIGMDEALLSAETIPVTFTFEEAGSVTVGAVVSAPLRLTLNRFLREDAAGDR